MSSFSLNKLPKKERIRMISEFYDIVDSLKNRKEVQLFFKDVLTPNEIGNLMRRVEVAMLLISGFNYKEIVELLGVGKTKVNTIQRSLNYKGDGYRLVVKRVIERRKQKKMKELKRGRRLLRKHEKPSIEYLKHKYPLHFLLWNIVDELGDYFYAKKLLKTDHKEIENFYRERAKSKNATNNKNRRKKTSE